MYFAGDQVTGRTLSLLNLTWVTVFITLIDYTDKRQDGSTSTDKESSSHRSRPDGSRYRVSPFIPASRKSSIDSYVAALHAKVPLTIYDPSPKVLSSALTKLESLLSRDVSKNRISQSDSDQARERVTGVNGDGTTGEVIEGVDLVIEVRSSS